MENASLDHTTGLWTIKLENKEQEFKCRVRSVLLACFASVVN